MSAKAKTGLTHVDSHVSLYPAFVLSDKHLQARYREEMAESPRENNYLKIRRSRAGERTMRVQVEARSAAVSAVELGHHHHHQGCFPKTGISLRFPPNFLATDCD